MFINFGKWNSNYKYLIFGAISAFFTNYIFGFIYDDDMNFLILTKPDNNEELSKHIIYHYIFRFLGIFIISIIAYKYEIKLSRTKSTNISRNSVESSAIILIYKSAKEDLNKKISSISVCTILSLSVSEVILGDLFFK